MSAISVNSGVLDDVCNLELGFDEGKSSGDLVVWSWYRSSWAQLILLSCSYFCGIGMWNALNGLGGLGTGDPHVSSLVNVCLYFTGTVACFFSGSFVNVLGLRASATAGSAAQAALLFSVWAYFYRNAFPSYVLVILTIVCGASIGWLLAAVASGLVHYPVEKQRAMFVAFASVALNVGGLSGAIMAFVMSNNVDETMLDPGTSVTGLSSTSYMVICFVCLAGVAFSLAASSSAKVVRSDGTQVVMELQDFRKEWQGILAGIKQKVLWLLVPLFMCSLWHEVVVFNGFNTGLFNPRSRAVNAGYYYGGRILSSVVFQIACDWHGDEPPRRRVRDASTLVALTLAAGIASSLCVLCNVGGIRHGGLADFTERRALSALFVFLSYGSLETMATSYSFWLIGLIPFEDPATPNRYVGWYRCFSSLGGFLSWAIDIGQKVPIEVQWGLNMALWASSLVCIQVLVREVFTTGKKVA